MDKDIVIGTHNINITGRKNMKKLFFILATLLVFTSCKKEFTITVQSNNAEWGSVSGSGTYAKGTTIPIEAIAKDGYTFVSWQDKNTENPRSIVVEANATYTATFEKAYWFSVAKDKKVVFSPGNLQWSATGGGSSATTHTVAGGGTAAGTWRFAPNQWDIIGKNNQNISSSYSGWIDLFGWGTSGYNGKYPYMTSDNNSDYGDGENNISGTNYDWGRYNAIYNPKSNTTDVPGRWRTLTSEEWAYLLDVRNTTSGIRYAKVTVYDIPGLIILPDNWSTSTYTLNNPNNIFAEYYANSITPAIWTTLENAGAVFLPAAGSRNVASVSNVVANGYYWSSSYDNCNAYSLYFNLSNVSSSSFYYRFYGQSVRLVRDAK